MAAHTILVVEDERDLRDLLVEALEMNGYIVVAAPEGRAALDALAHMKPPCVVLLDLLMPGMNGWDFLTALRGEARFADIPVIVHSSAPGTPAGATRVLGKPVDLERLLEVVREYCA